MSFRGRGRGRGSFGGGGFGRAKELPFELFPEIADLGKSQKEKNEKKAEENTRLIRWSMSLQKFWSSSSYFYEDINEEGAKKRQRTDIMRYSDKKSEATDDKETLSDLINLNVGHVPAELAGKKTGHHRRKRVKWNESDLQKLDFFEKLEQKNQGQEGSVKKENDEEEEGDVENEEDEEESGGDDGDYAEVLHCDDDEDDYNMEEDSHDEGSYD